MFSINQSRLTPAVRFIQDCYGRAATNDRWRQTGHIMPLPLPLLVCRCDAINGLWGWFVIPFVPGDLSVTWGLPEPDLGEMHVAQLGPFRLCAADPDFQDE